jgi:hypothetical protein
MSKAIMARDLKDPEEKAARRAKREARMAFRSKAFADLTAKEKDDLLKVLAIRTGIISE